MSKFAMQKLFRSSFRQLNMLESEGKVDKSKFLGRTRKQILEIHHSIEIKLGKGGTPN